MPIRIIIFEDNDKLRESLAYLLKSQPEYEMAGDYNNCNEAATITRVYQPDVVLMDIEMAGTNGLEGLKKIRKHSQKINVIMLTVFDDHDKIFKAICAGASGYLLKTSAVEKIVESIRDVYAGGASMTPRVAHSVLDMFGRLQVPQRDYGLTIREQSILELMTEGLIKKEIAERLSLSYHTVDTQLRNIYAKLHVNTRSGAVAKALKERLL